MSAIPNQYSIGSRLPIDYTFNTWFAYNFDRAIVLGVHQLKPNNCVVSKHDQTTVIERVK